MHPSRPRRRAIATPALLFLTVYAGLCGSSTTEPEPIDQNPDPLPAAPMRAVLFSDARGNTGRDIWGMNPDGSGQVQITNLPENEYDAVRSQDGRRIAFVSNRGVTEGAYSRVFIMDSDGSDIVALTDPADFVTTRSPSFSADGTRIAFDAQRRGETGHDIWVMDATDGGNLKRIVSLEGGDYNPRFSPVRDEMAFQHTIDSNHSEIYLLREDGTIVAMTSGQALKTGPKWSSNGEEIFFSGRTGDSFNNRELYAVDRRAEAVRHVYGNGSYDIGSYAVGPDHESFLYSQKYMIVGFRIGQSGAKVASLKDGSAIDWWKEATEAPEAPEVPAAVAQVSVSPDSATLTEAETVQLEATATDAAGAALEGRSFEWASSDSAVATVTGSGLVRAVSAGKAEITATSEGVAGGAVIVVESEPVSASDTTRVTLTPVDRYTYKRLANGDVQTIDDLMVAGDHDAGGDGSLQAFAVYLLDGLPTGGTVVRAALDVSVDPETVGSPFTLEGLYVEGAASAALNEDDVASSAVLVADEPGDVTVEIAGIVDRAYADDGELVILRFRFSKLSNGDGDNDYAYLSAGQLVVDVIH